MLKTTAKRGSFTNIGILSLLAVFVVLCLTALGALSLATAYADMRTAHKYGDTVAAYYRAESTSQRIIAALGGGTNQDDASEEYGVFFENKGTEENPTVSYEILIGDGPNRLSVTLGLEDGKLRCLRHCVVSDAEQGEDYYELIS